MGILTLMNNANNSTEKLTAATITDDEIRALADNAGTAGDLEQVEICEAALAGNESARAECAKVINAGRA